MAMTYFVNLFKQHTFNIVVLLHDVSTIHVLHTFYSKNCVILTVEDVFSW